MKAKRYDHKKISSILYNLFNMAGVPTLNLYQLVDKLIQSDLEGHPSHGIMRVPWYIEMIKSCEVKIRPLYSKKEIEGTPITIIDGDHGLGQIIGDIAVKEIIEKVEISGVGVVGIKNVGHLGRLSDYVRQIAEKGYIGLMFTSIGGNHNIVAPYGAPDRKMGTNPMAFAAPDENGCAILDMSTAFHSYGSFEFMKILGATKAGNKCIVDSDRILTDKLEILFKDGSIIPFGSYKGYGLNFMIEILTGILLGDGFIGQSSNKFSNPSLLIAINPEYFEATFFKNKISSMINYLKKTKNECYIVYYPGESEELRYENNIENGIMIPDEVVNQIQEEINKYGLGLKISDCKKEQ